LKKLKLELLELKYFPDPEITGIAAQEQNTEVEN